MVRCVRSVLVAAACSVSGVGVAACTPVSSGVVALPTRICAPAGQLLHRIDIKIVSGTDALTVSMNSELKDHSDATTLEFDVAAPSIGATYSPPWVPDPGRCVEATSSGSLQVSSTLVPETDLATIVAFYAIPPAVINGD